ncbi:hypothetical protein L596_017241 [Steinernema carpocapsae]|uniref:SRR1-like domain-containing protein n=1 Tax=Steinernema carpocapsae TaxID=34508 RepID=A0A4U5N1C6_STECR|nr:hypothetical protein L596_017241 [Steinernema carpocapsae]
MVFLDQSQLFDQIAKDPKSGWRKKTPISLETVIFKIVKFLDGRRIRHFKGIWTLDTGNDCQYRLMNLEIFLALKKKLKPARASFEDLLLTENEKNVLSSVEIETPPPSDFTDYVHKPTKPDEVDVFYLPQCCQVLEQNLLYSLWNPNHLQDVIFIGDFVRNYPQGNIGSPLFTFCHPKGTPLSESEPLFDYHLEGDYIHNDCNVLVCRYSRKPLPDVTKPTYKGVLLSPVLFEKLSEADKKTHLKKPANVDDIEHNLKILGEQIRNEEFGTVGHENIAKQLNGRKLKRIRAIATGHFGFRYKFRRSNLNGQIELAWILALKERYNVQEISCQDPCLSEFELSYLNSIGIATPPNNQQMVTEEDLQEGEVALLWMLCSWRDTQNNVLWANRHQMDKIVMIGNNHPDYTKSNFRRMSFKEAVLPTTGLAAVSGVAILSLSFRNPLWCLDPFSEGW